MKTITKKSPISSGARINLFIVRTFFKLLVLLLIGLCLLCISSIIAKAQNNVAAKEIVSYNVSDTSAAQAYRLTIQNLHGNAGGFYFDETRNKWRIWDGTEWTDLTGQGVEGSFWPLGGDGIVTDDVYIYGSTGANRITIGTNSASDSTVEAVFIHGNEDVQVISGETKLYVGDGEGVTGSRFEINGTDKMTIDETEIISLTKHIMTPTASEEGLNIGSIGTNPSAPDNGGHWYNSTNHRIYYRQNGSSNAIFTIADASIVVNRIPFINGSMSSTTTDTDLTFTSGNTLNTFNSTIANSLNLTSFSPTSVLYVGSSNEVQENVNFLWDDATSTFTGGAITLTGGQISTKSGWNAGMLIIPGTVSGGGNDLSLSAGFSNGGGGNGGDITISAGDGNGAGTSGNVLIAGKSSTGGYIFITGIPTSCAGAPSGALWNDGGTLKICP